MLLPALVAAALAVAMPAIGAWGGQVDGNGHPFVGAMYADFDGDVRRAGQERR